MQLSLTETIADHCESCYAEHVNGSVRFLAIYQPPDRCFIFSPFSRV